MTAPYLPRAPRQPTPQEIAAALGMVPMAGAPDLTSEGISPYTGPKAGVSQGGAGWAARLFGGADPFAGGLLNAPEARGLGRNALFQTGLALLQNSGPAPYRRGLGEILGTSLAQGQHAYETGVQGTLAQRQLRQQQAEQQRIAQRRQELAGMIAQNPDFNVVVPRVIAAAAGGDENATKILGALSNLRTETGRPAISYRESIDPATGKRATAVIDERKPTKPLGYLPLPEREGNPLVDEARRSNMANTQFQQENALTDDFRSEATPWQNLYQSLQGAVGQIPAAVAGDGAAQINTLYAFVRALDPQSVVREGELALAQSASNPYARAKTLLDKYGAGENVIVPESLLRQMGSLMAERSRGIERRYEARRKDFQKRAARWHLSSDLFPPLVDTNVESGDTQGRPASPVNTLLAPRPAP